MQIELPPMIIRRFCQKHHIRKLSVFGSVLREDFRPESDIDFLVEFDPNHIPGLIRLAGIASHWCGEAQMSMSGLR
jgi:uncharacterized protein